ncbi:monocarboxylate transporter 14 [Elysia marginata]|uniref:Monocarboxylate transporter 14 n=1 Tax=Elysia marginata TaxID=1093978 RepID=A0AAV4EI16_9GAST|nr:monocarboxylate transporter 14 [Elysia marginata]
MSTSQDEANVREAKGSFKAKGSPLSRTPRTPSPNSQAVFKAETLLYTLNKTNLDIGGKDEVDDHHHHHEKDDHLSSGTTTALQASFRGLDGGYGWLITLGAFIAFVVEGAFERGEGIIYPYFLERFRQSNQLTTLPSATASTLRFMLSPVASVVCNRYSIRASAMVGAVVFALGVFLTQFAQTIIELFFTFGLLTGCGRAFFSGPGLIVIGLYFRQRQGLASGIAMSGVGCGAFLLVPLIDFLFKEYGFQGAFLILSGIACNILVVAMLYRPLSTNNRYLAVAAQQKLRVYMSKQHSEHDHHGSRVSIARKTLSCFEEEMRKARAISTRISDEAMALPFRVTRSGHVETEMVQSHNALPQPSSRCQKLRAVLCHNCCCDICFPVEDFNVNVGGRKKTESGFQPQLLLHKAFMFYSFAIFFFVSSFKIVLVFMPILMQTKGSSLQDAAFMLSLAGLLDVLSRICFGFLLDARFVRPYRERLFNFVLVGMAVAAGLLPTMDTLIGIGVTFAAYSMGASFCLIGRTVVLVDLIGARKLSSAFGIHLFIQGFGALLGPPVAGLLLDVYGSISYGYYFASVCMAASAACMSASISFHSLSHRHSSDTRHSSSC